MKGKIFNAQEVQAILNGSKVMFREVIEPQPFQSNSTYQSLSVIRDCPYQVGQKIFCKESFAEIEFGGGMGYNSGKQMIYKVDDDYDVKWKPAKHMKQEHSRLTLLIKEIRVERLAEISEEDAIAEGVDKLFTEEEMKHVAKVHQTEKNDTYKNYLWHGHIGKTITNKQSDEWEYQYSSYKEAKESFATLWNATHKKPEEKFEASPWVWKVEMEVVKC